MYEAVHPRTSRVLLAGEKHLLIREPRVRGYEDEAETQPVRPTRKSVMFVQASDGGAPNSPRGSLPSDDEVAAFATPWVVVMHHHLYRDHDDGAPNSAPPYDPILPNELRRFNAACLRHNIYSLAYVSPFDAARQLSTAEDAESDNWLPGLGAGPLIYDYGYRGFYVDGLFFDTGSIKLDNAKRCLEQIHHLRTIVGPTGVLVAHLSHGNQPAAFLPAVERYCDGVVKGEGFKTDTLDDPYLLHEIATTRWTGTPVGWLYHRTWDRLQNAGVTLDALMRWQAQQGMMGVTFSQMKVEDGRYRWSDGRTSYFQAWQRAVEEAENA